MYQSIVYGSDECCDSALDGVVGKTDQMPPGLNFFLNSAVLSQITFQMSVGRVPSSPSFMMVVIIDCIHN